MAPTRAPYKGPHEGPVNPSPRRGLRAHAMRERLSAPPDATLATPGAWRKPPTRTHASRADWPSRLALARAAYDAAAPEPDVADVDGR